jgi:hypothetical protein
MRLRGSARIWPIYRTGIGCEAEKVCAASRPSPSRVVAGDLEALRQKSAALLALLQTT